MQRNKRSVFIVHGRDQASYRETDYFLRCIGLEPIEWEQARLLTNKSNPMTNEIIRSAFEYAEAIVVLLSPEDYAYLHNDYIKPDDESWERKPTLQPRQNVLFELGMAMGQSEEKTVVIQFGYVRPFTDMAGRHFSKIDSIEGRKEVAQRLKTAGCEVDLSGSTWMSITKNKTVMGPNLQKELLEVLQAISVKNNSNLPSRFEDIQLLGSFGAINLRHYLSQLLDADLISQRLMVDTPNANGNWYLLTSSGIEAVSSTK